ncbi:hypothetical protein ENHY17A_110085 [Moraxellaceae bacterium 17A]|nr:hypothetical protein ENHY17A_110085 [Moraxellaceae bacterium 17A]
MNKSQLFQQAHALAKSVIKTGDNYQATFALCLKAVYAQSKSQVARVKDIITQAVNAGINQDANNQYFQLIKESVVNFGAESFRKIKTRQEGIDLFNKVLANLELISDKEWSVMPKSNDMTVANFVIAKLIRSL